jgi:hypothetical protein
VIGWFLTSNLQPIGDFAFEPLKADYGPLAKALTFNPQKVCNLKDFLRQNSKID